MKVELTPAQIEKLLEAAGLVEAGGLDEAREAFAWSAQDYNVYLRAMRRLKAALEGKE